MSGGSERIAVVTGASSGIGLALAKKYLSEGWKVYGLCRTRVPEDGIITVKCDVTDEESVAAAFAKIDKIDLLICNAGCGISGAIEFTEPEDLRRQFDVVFFGTDRCVRQAVPKLRASKGKVICISSVAAVYSIPFQSYYSAAKSSVNAYAAALANELRRFGVSVCAVMLGDAKTGFTDSRRKSEKGDDVYGGSISASVAVMEKDERGGMDPDVIARRIYKISLKKRMPPRKTIGAVYKIFVFLGRILPVSAQNFIISKMYVKK
ncbi:MAG: SDR family NAD(P)-dependent oxidoreductase [Clostridia bacterium]|nr:SDR family NAD(P)-dependent oxidoreductase [Clostridia bacterium]